MKPIFAFLFILFVLSQSHASGPTCKVVVSENQFEKQMEDLARLREQVRESITQGASPIEISVLKNNYQKTEKQLFEQYQKQTQKDYSEFNKRLTEIAQELRERNKTQNTIQQQERENEERQMRERERKTVIAVEEINTELDSMANIKLMLENYPPDWHNGPGMKHIYNEKLKKIFDLIATLNLPYTEEMISAKIEELKNEPNRLPNLRRR